MSFCEQVAWACLHHLSVEHLALALMMVALFLGEIKIYLELRKLRRERKCPLRT